MSAAAPNTGQAPVTNFDSVRDFVRELDARGRLLRIEAMDQDEYEVTAFAYRLIDKFGIEHAPAFLIEKVKIGGQWLDGPVVANPYGRWIDEATLFGVEHVTQDVQEMYHAVIASLQQRLDPAGTWRRIAPVAIAGSRAPCKEIVLRGDEIDIRKFPFLMNNPADGGRYINMGSVVIQDPELGSNVGTYRCQIKGARKIGVNPEPGQHGWQILQGMKRRGDKLARVAIAVAPDSLTFCASSTKMAGFGEDEFEYAGGLRGKPLELVRCETSDLRVPAHAEMIIEGEVPLDEFEDEGPYGEMFGYLGPMKPGNFFMNIQCVTHRRHPWVLNSFTGLTCDMPRAPQIAAELFRYRRLVPSLTAMISPRGANGVYFASINKRLPGEGMMAGQYLVSNPGLCKLAIVVDADVNVLNTSEVMHALAARWQPSASLLIPQTMWMPPDPSRARWGVSSKMVIDATRQLPGEGGPKTWPAASRKLLEEGAPDAFARVDARWDDYLRNWA